MFWSVFRREQAVVNAEVKFTATSLKSITLHWLLLTTAQKVFPGMYSDSDIARVFECGRTKATAIVAVIAQDVMKEIERVSSSKFFSIQVDESTGINVYGHIHNMDGKVCSVIYKLESLQSADTRNIFVAIDLNLRDAGLIC